MSSGVGSTSTETRALIPNSTDTKKNDDTTSHSNEELTLRIKCNSPGVELPSSGVDFVEVCIKQSSDVNTLKESVRKALGQASRGRYLRLIASGRLLAPDSSALATFKMKDEDYVHAVLAPAGVRGGQQAAMARGQVSASSSGSDSRRFHRNIGIGPTGLILGPPSEWDDSDDDLEAGAERAGFDRLRSTGLTRDEVDAIRLYFSSSVERFIEERRRRNSSSENETPESDSDSQNESDEDQARRRRLQMEDEWMDAQGPTSEFRLNLSANNPWLSRGFTFAHDDPSTFGGRPHNMVGTDKDFMWGFFLGFFVGFIMLFWVWMPTVPHKQKLGILTGISFQLALNMLRSTGNNGGDEDSDEGR